jgi:hypothetical protein
MSVDHTQCTVRQVADVFELEQALKLVHDSYVDRGYMSAHPSELRLCIQDALPQTRTFVAQLQGRIIATVSLFFDSTFGLPLDSLYRDELDILRHQGRRIGEVGMLADRRRALLRSLPLVLRLMKLVFWSAREKSLDDLIIATHPRHANFYQRLLCFEQFAEIKYYSAVRNAPAVPMRLDLAGLDPAQVQGRIRELFFSPLHTDALGANPYRIDAEGLRYLFVERTDMLKQLSPFQRRELQKLHRGVDIDALATADRSE